MNHSDHVQTIAQQVSAAASSPIAASWRRCMTQHGLSPEETRTPIRLSEKEFSLAMERSGALLEEAASELDRLFSTVGKAGCCLLLTDGQGVALDRRGAAGDDKDFRGIGLWSGTLWSEASVGTNGIGTAIADERAVIIHRDQHFLTRNTGLSCATAPIRDHKGRIAAAIDISTCRDDVGDMAMTDPVAGGARCRRPDRDQSLPPCLSGCPHPAGARRRQVRARPSRHRPRRSRAGCDTGRTASAEDRRSQDRRRHRGGRSSRREAGADGSDLPDAERAALRRVLSRAGGNVSQAAEMLGISRATLYRKMKPALAQLTCLRAFLALQHGMRATAVADVKHIAVSRSLPALPLRRDPSHRPSSRCWSLYFGRKFHVASENRRKSVQAEVRQLHRRRMARAGRRSLFRQHHAGHRRRSVPDRPQPRPSISSWRLMPPMPPRTSGPAPRPPSAPTS